MEQDAGHVQEDGLVGRRISDRSIWVRSEENSCGQRHEDGAEHAQCLPANAPAAALGCVLRATQSHKANDNVRLAEVAQTPTEQTDNRD